MIEAIVVGLIVAAIVSIAALPGVRRRLIRLPIIRRLAEVDHADDKMDVGWSNPRLGGRTESTRAQPETLIALDRSTGDIEGVYAEGYERVINATDSDLRAKDIRGTRGTKPKQDDTE